MVQTLKTFIISALCFIIGVCNAANILAFLPVPSNSFIRGFHPMLRDLAERGHNLTVYSIHPLPPPVPDNYKEIIVDNVFLTSKELAKILKAVTVNNNPWASLRAQMVLGPAMAEAILKLPQVYQLIHSKETYDLVIISPFMALESFMGFSYKFKAHTISVYPNAPVPLHGYYSGDQQKYAYIPNLRFPYSDRMKLFQRVENTLFGFYETIWSELYYTPIHEALMRKYFAELELPPLSEMLRNISLYLYDITLSHSFIMPQLPNHIYIGGLTVTKEESLPKDIQLWMDESKHGVVLFSLGSNAKATDLPKDKLAILLNVFSKLEQRVLMKWESNVLPNQPENVKIVKWLPQTDILRHPSCKLFLTHGGMHSLIETVHYGVPFVGLPLYVDQEHNLMKLQSKGVGLYLTLQDISQGLLTETLNKVLLNTSFKENAVSLSKIMHDQPITSLQSAVFWIEYILRHNGALHLRSAGVYLSWYQQLLLDVYFIIFILPVLTLIVTVYILKLILKLFSKTISLKKNKSD